MRPLRVTSRNAAFQQWQALLTNRSKRQRAGEFLVQGVRPVSQAVSHGWPVRAVLLDGDRPRSAWAAELLARLAAPGRSAPQQHLLAGELMHELGGKQEQPPELLLVVAVPDDDLARLPAAPGLVVVYDRPASPGNIGTVVRSIDALGGDGLIVCGHAADPYDPKAVRASTGSLFAVPVVRSPSPAEVLAWLTRIRTAGVGPAIVGTDEHGELSLPENDFRQPTVVVIGNEAAGLSAAWRQACDRLVRIPMAARAASSLNAAGAAAVVLYEAGRQRASG
jgi:23S rRNA (uridine2479-2'-O)-methyltransferase